VSASASETGPLPRARRTLSSPLVAMAARRLVVMALLLVLISFLVFALLHMAPGDPIQILLGTRPADPDTLATLRAEHHLDEPLLTQYWYWLGDAVRLDFGDSIQSGQSVSEILSLSLPITLFLGTYSMLIAIVIGIPLGVLSALRSRTALDRGVVAVSVVGVSTPAFVSGVFLLYLFAVALGAFPTFGAGNGFGDRLWHLTLPALGLAFTALAIIVKLTRTAMIHELDQDYVAFARARGVPQGRVIVRHALRNALGPVITSIGLVFPIVFTGAVLIEVTFALPGLGSALVDAVDTTDVPVVQAATLIAAAMIIFFNLVVDLVQLALDPRLRPRGRA
jgi:peptide/nickel transport system permease protein